MESLKKYLEEFSHLFPDSGNISDDKIKEKIRLFIIESLLNVQEETRNTISKEISKKIIVLGRATRITYAVANGRDKEEVVKIFEKKMAHEFADDIYNGEMIDFSEERNRFGDIVFTARLNLYKNRP